MDGARFHSYCSVVLEFSEVELVSYLWLIQVDPRCSDNYQGMASEMAVQAEELATKPENLAHGEMEDPDSYESPPDFHTL